MRRSELDPKLAQLAERLFVGAREVLAVGVQATLSEHTVTVADDTAQLRSLPGRYRAALWRLGPDTSAARAGVLALRGALLPGAPLLLLAEKRPAALDQLRAVFSREPVPRASLESLCQALLLSGYAAPRVHDSLPGWLAVSATLPAARTALDVFFEQPAHPPSR